MTDRRPPPATKPLQAHKESPLTAFESEVGKIKIVQKDEKFSNAASIGFYCSTCKASFTSSDAYLDHCNGRIHLKNLGIAPKVERLNEVDRVKARLQALSKQKSQRNEVLDAPAASLLEARLNAHASSSVVEKPSAKKSKNSHDAGAECSKISEPKSDIRDSDGDEDLELLAAMGFKSFV
jgi:U4/U6.U5 tri-snRNP component SNU23